MQFATVSYGSRPAIVSRSGYTGEDGFEIWTPADAAPALWAALASDERVEPAGLGARDSLRLEAGLPLYGHDLDDSVSPFEAGLGFAVSKRRPAAAALPGSDRLRREREGGLSRQRVGLRILGGAPAREGALIADLDGVTVGRVTSGGFLADPGRPHRHGFCATKTDVAWA